MLNHIHPIMVHFPIALFLSALALEALSLIFKKEPLHQAAWYNYILAVLAAIGSALSGLLDDKGLHHPVFTAHHALAVWTLVIAFLSAIVLFLARIKLFRLFRILFLIFLIVLALLVSLTGYYGGRLVYEYGVGVE